MLTLLMSAALAVNEPKCPLPGDWELDPSTSDEFDGTELDRGKWWDYLPHFVGRMTYFNHGRNVKVKDGCLELWTVLETDPAKMPYGWLEEGREPYSTAAVKSRRKVKGGYFECRMKMNTAPVRGAFWLYDPLSDNLRGKYGPGEYSEEIDICEVEGRHQAEDAGRPYLVNNYTHHYVTPYYEGVCNQLNVPYGNRTFVDEDLSQDFHTYGLYWGEEEIVWYFDGRETFRIKHNNTSYGGFYRPLHVVLDSEIVDWHLSRCVKRPIDRGLLPSVEKIDWVRHWVEKPRPRGLPLNPTAMAGKPDRKALPPCADNAYFDLADAMDVPTRPSGNLILNGSFEQRFLGWHWQTGGAKWSDVPEEKLHEGIVEDAKFGRRALAIRSTQGGVAALCSRPVPTKEGQTYVLSFWAKAPKKASLAAKPCSAKRDGKFNWQRPNPDFDFSIPGGNVWTRFERSFVADRNGVYIQLYSWNDLTLDGIRLEEGESASAWRDEPVTGVLLTSNRDNDIRLGDAVDARLELQGADGTAGSVTVSVLNFYSETVWERTFAFTLPSAPLALDVGDVGTGIFVVRTAYDVGGARWRDYQRFQVMKPLANRHPTATFYANFPWFHRLSRGEDMARKMMEWGFGATDGASNGLYNGEPFRDLFRKYRIRQFVHPVAYEMNEGNSGPRFKWNGPRFRAWTNAAPDLVEMMERNAYDFAMKAAPDDDLWTFWNEEEAWARSIGFDEHCKVVMACRRGVRRAFAERGLPPPRFCETHGTSHYFQGRNYDAIEGYLAAANRAGFKYDVVTVHPYQNIDGGTLGPKDADFETQQLLRQMKEAGYPDSTPIMFTECYNMLPLCVPAWGANGWADSYHAGAPGLALGRMEFLHAASAARQYLVNLKFWPRLQLVHNWQHSPVMDANLTPYMWIKAVNTLGNLLPSPKFVGDAQPFADVRGYCFEQDGKAVLAVWTTNHDVENQLRRGATLTLDLPPDVRFVDLMGNERAVDVGTGRGFRLPLTCAPLFLVADAKEGRSLLRALEESDTDDTAASVSLDVRPDLAGDLNLIVRNETKRPQKGTVKVGAKSLAYDLAPQATTTLPLVRGGGTAPMTRHGWNERVSIVDRDWSLEWFYVPKCGEKPDWSKIPALDFVNACGQPTMTGRARLAWNEEYFFVRVEVEDDRYLPIDPAKPFDPGALYEHDASLEIFFDGFGDARAQGEKGYDLNDSRYDFAEKHAHRLVAVNWQLAQGTASATDQEIREKLQRTFTRTEKGVVYEVAFAKRYMAPIDLRPGTVAGLGLYVHDHDLQDGKRVDRGGLSFAVKKGADCNLKPHVWPLMVLGE